LRRRIAKRIANTCGAETWPEIKVDSPIELLRIADQVIQDEIKGRDIE